MKPIQLSVLFVSGLTPMVANTTSIVLIRTPNQLVLATDSLRAFHPAESGEDGVFDVCKIHVVKNFAYSAAGMTLTIKGPLDTFNTTSKILAQKGTLDAKAHRIAAALEKPLLQALVWSNKNIDRPKVHTRDVLPMSASLSIVIAGVESGVLEFATIELETQNDSKGIPIKTNAVVDSCTKAGCKIDGFQWRMFGFKKAATAIVDADKDFFTPDLVSDARRLIEIEIKNAPNDVGPPISIMSIDVMGLHWLANSCSE